MSAERRTKVLIVDDSAIVRKLLTEALASEPDLEVIGTAPDPFVARDKILSLKPDVVTLDIEMPRMDGLTFLKKLMRFHPMPVIVISSLAQSSSRAAIEAFEVGAVDVLGKPGGPYSVGEMMQDLPRKIRAAAQAHLRRAPAAEPPKERLPVLAVADRKTVIAIGASTGGTEAIREVLMQMPENCPGIVVVQHIPPIFSTAFANRLNDLSRIRVKEAVHGDVVAPGLALIAPGNFHMTLRKRGNEYCVSVEDGPRVCYQRPSVDVLFDSVSETAGRHAIGAILTGMGADGAQGMLKMKRAGARTVAQDEASSVVFGMPREAIRLGAVDQVLPLNRIASELTMLSASAIR